MHPGITGCTRKHLPSANRHLPMWVWILELSFAGFVASFLTLIWKGSDREGRFHLRRGSVWLALTMVCLLLWLVSLPRA
ncbi:MAG: hypothetical protein GW893_02415 [Armatimonadetes bacterium]|nr:hypothetical protein [Armatimonadota bacterium]